MKKKILINIFIIGVLLSITSTITLASNIQVNNVGKSEKNIYSVDGYLDQSSFTEPQNVEEKILMYDATTGKTTEIDMQKIKQSIATTYNISEEIIDYTTSYDPYETDTKSTYSGTITGVSNVTEFPYRVTCRIIAENYEKVLVASGFLVGPNLLLTSAHCVMNRDDSDKTFANWVAYPGYANGAYLIDGKPVCSGWSKIIYSSEWTSNHSIQSDWCLCILNSNIGSQVGWYGCQSYGTNAEMSGIAVRSLGYPAALQSGTRQYYTTGTLSNINNGYFYTSAEIFNGMSGGPIARLSDNYAIGINKGYTSTSGVGTRITQHIIDLIIANS